MQGADLGTEQVSGRHHQVGESGSLEAGPGVEPIGPEACTGHPAATTVRLTRNTRLISPCTRVAGIG